jgi:CMP-N-acetylneuraminic acid synthetase
MDKNKKILAIIPARGGSKGLPGKNIRPLLGKPLIGYAIDAIRQSKYDIDIYVSTDSDEIANVALQCGVETIKRPDELATDKALVKDAIQYTIKELEKRGQKYDAMLLIEATSPMRDGADIDESLDKYFSKEGVDCVATFSEMDPPVTRTWKIENDVPSPFIEGSNPFRPRQEQISGYYINGLVYVFNVNTLMNNHTDTLFVGNQLAVITKKLVVDIDNIDDFRIAEYLLKSNQA